MLSQLKLMEDDQRPWLRVGVSVESCNVKSSADESVNREMISTPVFLAGDITYEDWIIPEGVALRFGPKDLRVGPNSLSNG
jgi:hypothetical protein